MTIRHANSIRTVGDIMSTLKDEFDNHGLMTMPDGELIKPLECKCGFVGLPEEIVDHLNDWNSELLERVYQLISLRRNK